MEFCPNFGVSSDFKPRSRFLLFIPSSSIACISISVAFWNFALILVSLQHFKPRSHFLLFLPSSSIAFISIFVALWNFALILLPVQHFKPISRFLLCLEVVFFSSSRVFPSLAINLCGSLKFCPNFALSSAFQAYKPFSSLPRSRFFSSSRVSPSLASQSLRLFGILP